MTKEMIEQLKSIKKDASGVISEIDALINFFGALDKVATPIINASSKRMKLHTSDNDEITYYLTDSEHNEVVEIATKITKNHILAHAGKAIVQLNKLQDAKDVFERMADDK